MPGTLHSWTDEQIAEYKQIRDWFRASRGKGVNTLSPGGHVIQIIRATSDEKNGNDLYPGKIIFRNRTETVDGPNVWIDAAGAAVFDESEGYGTQTGYAVADEDEEDVRAVFYVPEFTGGDRSKLVRLTARHSYPGTTAYLYDWIEQFLRDDYGYDSGGSGGIGASVTVENTVEANGVDVSDVWVVTVSNATGCTLCLEIDGNTTCLAYNANAAAWDAAVGAGITVSGSLTFTFDGDFDAHEVSWVQPRRLCPPPSGVLVDWNSARIVTDADGVTGRRLRIWPGRQGNLNVTVTRLSAGNGEDTQAALTVTITDAAGGTLTPVVDGESGDPFTPYDPAATIDAAFPIAVTISGLTETAASTTAKVVQFTVTFDGFDDHTLTFTENLTEILIYHGDGGPDFDLCRQRWAHAEEITGYVEDPEFDQVHRVGSDGCGYLDTPADCDP